MARPRAADDFDTIRARVKELRLERERALAGQKFEPAAHRPQQERRKDQPRFPRSAFLRKLVD